MDSGSNGEDIRLGSPIICCKCGEESYHPFYACKKDCPLTVNHHEKAEIHKKFEPSYVRCKERKLPCGNMKMNRSGLLDHLKGRHNIKQVTLYPDQGSENSLGVVHFALPSDKLQENQKFRWTTTNFVCLGKEFFFSAVVDPSDTHGSSVHFWVFINDLEDEANNYKYSLSLSSSSLSKSQKNKFHWTRTVHSWSYYDFNKIKSRRETVPIPVKTLAPLCKRQEGKRHSKYFNLSIEMFRSDSIQTP